MSDFKATFMNGPLRVNNAGVTLFWIWPLCSGQCQCTQGDSGTDSYNNSVCLCFPGGWGWISWPGSSQFAELLGDPTFYSPPSLCSDQSVSSTLWEWRFDICRKFPFTFGKSNWARPWSIELANHLWVRWGHKMATPLIVWSSNGELKDPLKVKRGRIQKKGSSNCVNQSG